MKKFSIEIIENLACFEGLRDEWNDLLKNSSSDCFFLTWEWLYTWWKHFSENSQLHIVAVRHEGKLCGIAPFTLRSRRWKRLLPFSALEFLGTGSVGSDYLDILVRRGHEFQVLFELSGYLADVKFMFELSRVEKNIAYACKFAMGLTQRGWSSTKISTDVCPYVDLLGHDWESYLESLSRAHRYNLRRRLRNMEKRWDTRFDLVQSEEQRTAAMQILIALHGKRWRERGSPGAFNSSALVSFHNELSRLALDKGWLRLYVLRLNGEPAAALYGFFYNRIFYFYQSGFNLDFYQHSVGLVTMGLAINSAISEGAIIYDFLRGNESYKSLWANGCRELIRLELYPPGVRGMLCRQTMELRSNIKKISVRLPSLTARIGMVYPDKVSP